MNLIAKMPEIAATIIPTITGPKLLARDAPIFPLPPSTTRDPSIEGIEIKNANSTAKSLSRRVRRPPTSVEPDLEIPGVIAMP